MMKPSRYQNRLLCAQSAFGGRGGTWKGFLGMGTSKTVQQMMLEMLGNPKEPKGSGDGSIMICIVLFLISKEWAFLKDENAPLCCLLLGLECRMRMHLADDVYILCCFRNLVRPIARQKRLCTCWTNYPAEQKTKGWRIISGICSNQAFGWASNLKSGK